jgi:hypothetical protein
VAVEHDEADALALVAGVDGMDDAVVVFNGLAKIQPHALLTCLMVNPAKGDVA